ncbi:hypothetical protein SAMN05428988_4191 [Chitinophaga sp. YR573]|uniref:hypothetical protein n=1 Tax=Chitinophaga sp. YR573 TaxID=1881040 RepID=UPI0008B2D0CF|nr:hypothetical protein [Chitinophaga sp. YR573]SEW34697.1 hypothetical protein SAMN05428988_4191 [Chitinophaga sp. YR573]
MSKLPGDIGYITGIITETGVIAIIAASEELENKDIPHSLLAVLKDKTWKIFQEDMDIVSLTSGKKNFARHVSYMGIDGQLTINEPTAVHNEHVHKGKNGPNNLRTMSEVRAIGDYFVAVGMRRQVYSRKIMNGKWTRLDAGVILEEDSLEIAGFLSVDGIDDNEIYAVGYRGEIWMRQAKQWQQIDSPVNTRLECVRCGADGTVLICGDNGIVLKGRGTQWKVIQTNETGTFKSATQFRGQWYVADEEGHLYIVMDDGLHPEPGFEKLGVTSGVIDSNENTLLSVGEEDIVLFDGKKWQRLKHPPFK